jgi:hypothetical protein
MHASKEEVPMAVDSGGVVSHTISRIASRNNSVTLDHQAPRCGRTKRLALSRDNTPSGIRPR